MKTELLDETWFNGPNYSPVLDKSRLTGQLARIFNCMKDRRWRTLGEIEDVTGDPQASISAQLRHLRKKRFGEYEVRKQNLGYGLYQYKVMA